MAYSLVIVVLGGSMPLEPDRVSSYRWLPPLELWWTGFESLDLGSGVLVQRLLGILLSFGGRVGASRSIFWACSVDLWICILKSFFGRAVLAYLFDAGFFLMLVLLSYCCIFICSFTHLWGVLHTPVYVI